MFDSDIGYPIGDGSGRDVLHALLFPEPVWQYRVDATLELLTVCAWAVPTPPEPTVMPLIVDVSPPKKILKYKSCPDGIVAYHVPLVLLCLPIFPAPRVYPVFPPIT